MRYIHTPQPFEAPESFKNWKHRHPNARYDRFKNSGAKQALKDSLVKRQKYICCYCETRITDDTSHIEHIEPQYGGQSNKTMTYSNMAASCIKDPQKLETPENIPNMSLEELRDSLLHCGHARGTHNVVSPYDARCERMFEYSFSGEVSVNRHLKDEDEKSLAFDSINYLRLNVPTLVALRRVAMFETIKMLDKGADPTNLLREIAGKLPPFYSAAKTALEHWKHCKNSD